MQERTNGMRRNDKGKGKKRDRREQARTRRFINQFLDYQDYCDDPDTFDNQVQTDLTLLIEE